MNDKKGADRARRCLRILAEEAAIISTFFDGLDPSMLDEVAGRQGRCDTYGTCRSKAEQALALKVDALRAKPFAEAAKVYHGVRSALSHVTGTWGRPCKGVDTLKDGLKSCGDRLTMVEDEILDDVFAAMAEATTNGTDLAGRAVSNILCEVADRVDSGTEGWFVTVTGAPGSGVSHTLHGIVRDVADPKTQVRRVAVPSPFSQQMMGVALARALDPTAPEKLDSARHDTAWNHARRFARSISVLVVDDVGNVPIEEAEAFGVAMKSISAIPARGMVIVLGDTDGQATQVLRQARLFAISTRFTMSELDDHGVVALGMQAAKTHGVSLGPDILGSWRRTRAIAAACGGRSGTLHRMVSSAARRANARGSKVVGYDDFRLTVDLSTVSRPKPADTET